MKLSLHSSLFFIHLFSVIVIVSQEAHCGKNTKSRLPKLPACTECLPTTMTNRRDNQNAGKLEEGTPCEKNLELLSDTNYKLDEVKEDLERLFNLQKVSCTSITFVLTCYYFISFHPFIVPIMQLC